MLPRDGFRSEPRRARIVDVAHWVSDAALVPLFALPVDPQDYAHAARIRRVP